MTRRSSRAEQLDWPGAGRESLFRRRMQTWFRRHQRLLPWRENRDPYRIWVSEVMLQQTQVATVIDYFERFIARFPDVASLAQAPLDQVLKIWEGLGYYRRARQLHAAARQLVEGQGGQFPQSLAEALKLPGIGRYTAGAVLSIAWDQPQPILEGNTLRLFSRLMGSMANPRSAVMQRRLWAFSSSLLPRTNGSGELNQALMELGSEVCRPRQPRCSQCPVAEFCQARRQGTQSRIPRIPPKFKVVKRLDCLIVVERKGQILMRRCGEDEPWAGLWDFPRLPVKRPHGREPLTPPNQRHPRKSAALSGEPQQAATLGRRFQTEFGLRLRLCPPRLHFNHSVTKYRIRLECRRGTVLAGRLSKSSSARWFPLAELAQLALNSTGRRVARQLLAGEF